MTWRLGVAAAALFCGLAATGCYDAEEQKQIDLARQELADIRANLIRATDAPKWKISYMTRRLAAAERMLETPDALNNPFMVLAELGSGFPAGDPDRLILTFMGWQWQGGNYLLRWGEGDSYYILVTSAAPYPQGDLFKQRLLSYRIEPEAKSPQMPTFDREGVLVIPESLVTNLEVGLLSSEKRVSNFVRIMPPEDADYSAMEWGEDKVAEHADEDDLQTP